MPWIDWWFNMAVIVTIGFVYYYAYLRYDRTCCHVAIIYESF